MIDSIYIHKIQENQIEENSKNIIEINAFNVIGRIYHGIFSFPKWYTTNYRSLRKKKIKIRPIIRPQIKTTHKRSVIQELKKVDYFPPIL